MIIDISFKASKQTFDIEFKESNQSLNFDFGEVQTVTEYVGGTLYDGDYEVTPTVAAKRLETAKKIMNEDLIIKAIPYAEVSNGANGKTVTIA